MQLKGMNEEEKLKFKFRLYEECESILLGKEANAVEQILDAQNAANSEDKSSAGDKHETGRALSQNTRDLNARILSEIKHDIGIFESIKFNVIYDKVNVGAIVITEDNNFFIAVGCGNIYLNEHQFITLSSKSPLVQALLGKEIGSKIIFNNRSILIQEIF
jgi:transcription elongation GreA/GreB family factor